MKTGRANYLVGAIFWFLFAGCTTATNPGHIFSPAAVEPIRRYPIKNDKIQAFSNSVRPINGELNAKYDLARHFQRIRKHRMAIETLKEVAQMDPTHALAHNAMGFSYDCLKEYKTAQHHYRTAILLDPQMDHAYNNLGYSYILDGKFAAAIAVLQQAIGLNEANAKYHKNLGLAYFKSNNLEKATLAFGNVEGNAKIENLIVRLEGNANNDQTADVDRTHAAPPTAFPLDEKDNVLRQSEDTRPATLTIMDDQNIKKTPLDVAITSQTPEPPSDETFLSMGAVSTDNPPVIPFDQDTRIEVSNGNGVRRMARTVADHIQNNGGVNHFRLTNADHFGYPETVIYYRNGFYDQASRIKNLLPGNAKVGQLVEAHLDSDPIRVLIGRDLVPFNPHTRVGIKVDVSNGNGVNGMARRLGKHLSREGFRVGRLTNADHFRHTRTIVFFSKGRADQAKLIADALPGKMQRQLVELNNTSDRIQVQIGSDLVF